MPHLALASVTIYHYVITIHRQSYIPMVTWQLLIVSHVHLGSAQTRTHRLSSIRFLFNRAIRQTQFQLNIRPEVSSATDGAISNFSCLLGHSSWCSWKACGKKKKKEGEKERRMILAYLSRSPQQLNSSAQQSDEQSLFSEVLRCRCFTFPVLKNVFFL